MDRIANFFASPAMKVVLLAFALIFPLIAGSEYQIYVMALAFIWAIAVYGLNIITGFCGQLNLAHGGFFAIGAYVSQGTLLRHLYPVRGLHHLPAAG